MNTKKNLFKLGTLTAVISLGAGLFINLSKNALSVGAYTVSDLASEVIDLNDCTEQEIRDYYAGLNSLDISERQGTNLLKNLKPILSKDQKYYAYNNDKRIWKMYEITDRDWEKSPASSTVYGTYDPIENKIYNYQYGDSVSNSKNNPYIHALYINRELDNQTTAWDDHNQDAWGINREHIWAKSHGFDDDENSLGGARGDPMHLWAGNGWANHEHSNYFFAFVDQNRDFSDAGDDYNTIYNNLKGYSRTVGGNETVFEPQDCDKGDIARAIFYMVARYNNYAGETEGFDADNPNLVLLNDLSENKRTGTSAFDNPYGMGLLSDLLAWNKLDPVDEYEVHRNNLLYKNYTNNRNPFIDFPNWADAIWGTADLDGTNYDSHIVGRAYPATDPIGSVTGPFELSNKSIEIIVGDTAEIYGLNAEDVVTWTVEDDTVVSLDKATSLNKERVTITTVGLGTTTITATCNGVEDSCTVTVREPTPIEQIERTSTATTLAYRYQRQDNVEISATDELTREETGRTSSSYGDWLYDNETSDISYAGNSAGSYSSIQLRNSNNSGIVVTSNHYEMKARIISVVWNGSTVANRTLQIYGKNTPYSSSADLYDSEKKGTLLGTLKHTASAEIEIPGDYEYIGIRAYDGALYLNEISIQWSGTITVYDYSNTSIRFGGRLTQDLWNELDTDNHIIEGFGVMIATDDVLSEGLEIKDFYESAAPVEDNPDVTEEIVDYYMPKEEMATPVADGNEYYWNLFYQIDNLKTTYVSAAYIKTTVGYVFFGQVRYSAKTLAADYIANRGYADTVASGSLANLANI